MRAFPGTLSMKTNENSAVKVGLIGFGMAGQSFHAPVIRGVPGLELACILERHGSLAQQKYANVRVARTLEALLSDAGIQLCVIATPNTSHFDLARRCLEAGRHVVIDKPFATTTQEAENLVELAARRKLLLSVYHNRRYDGDFGTIRQLIASGTLGEITEYEGRYDRFRPDPKPNAWRENALPGSGILFDLGPHVIDQALVLFGVPQGITARLLRQRRWSQVDDGFDVALEYPNFRALLRSRMLAYAPGPHYLIHGTKGSFVKYGMDPQEDPLRSGNVPDGPDWGADWGEEPEAQWGTLTIPQDGKPRVERVRTQKGDYRDFYANIRDAILGVSPLDVTPEQALRTMRALELAVLSDREKRTVAWPAESN